MDDSAAVRNALDALDSAFDQHDMDAVLDLCTEDVVFIGSGDGEEAVGREAIAPMFASLAPTSKDSSSVSLGNRSMWKSSATSRFSSRGAPRNS